MMNNPFDYFDKIVCICGQHEPERWIQVQIELEKIGVLDRVERFDEVINSEWLTENFGETSEWSKTDYCHWKIISDAHEQNLKNVFIFESDIHFIDTDLEKMYKSIESLNNVDWKLFYMGGIPHNVFGVENEHLVNVSMCQAHAYAINGSACKEVADKLLQGMIAIDQVYKREKQFGLGRYAYATHPRFVVQEDENIQTRKQYSNIMWQKTIEPMIEMCRDNYKFITMSPMDEGKLHRKILENFKKSLDEVGIYASAGFVEIINLKCETDYDKLNYIKSILDNNKNCLFSDPDIVFLKNPLTKLKEYLNDYDLIIQSNVTEISELKYFHKILNPGFCFVKSTELTKELFDTSQEIELLYEGVRPDEVYFNSKLNTDKFKDLKVKILNEDEFCLSYENKEKFESGLKPFIVHYNELPTRIFHPKNKIGKMRDNNHWLL